MQQSRPYNAGNGWEIHWSVGCCASRHEPHPEAERNSPLVAKHVPDATGYGGIVTARDKMSYVAPCVDVQVNGHEAAPGHLAGKGE